MGTGEVSVMIEVCMSETDRSELIVRSEQRIEVHAVTRINKNTWRRFSAGLESKENRFVPGMWVRVVKGDTHIS
jgi:hypothetical protein